MQVTVFELLVQAQGVPVGTVTEPKLAAGVGSVTCTWAAVAAFGPLFLVLTVTVRLEPAHDEPGLGGITCVAPRVTTMGVDWNVTSAPALTVICLDTVLLVARSSVPSNQKSASMSPTSGGLLEEAVPSKFSTMSAFAVTVS